MQRVCFLARIRPDRLEEYRERHDAVWPEMLDALRQAGWTNYSIFLSPDGLLVGYLETDDYPAALVAMAATEVNARWQAQTSPTNSRCSSPTSAAVGPTRPSPSCPRSFTWTSPPTSTSTPPYRGAFRGDDPLSPRAASGGQNERAHGDDATCLM